MPTYEPETAVDLNQKDKPHKRGKAELKLDLFTIQEMEIKMQNRAWSLPGTTPVESGKVYFPGRPMLNIGRTGINK